MLKKAVYGLKQSPRQWYNTIKPVLESVEVTVSPSDNGIFSGVVNGSIVLLGIYVDDLFIASESLSVLRNVKSKLDAEFAMKDMGIIKHYLDMDIHYLREEGKVVMSQSHFVSEILDRFSMSSCKPAKTPMESKVILRPHIDGETTIMQAPYRRLVGSVMYLMLCTRPEISFSVGVLSKFISSPTSVHWTSAKRLLRFLRGTSKSNLVFRSAKELNIVAYCDADWASSHDRKSTTGYLIYVGGNLVSWKSKKQSTVALSSTEAEIISATETTREILWIESILISFGLNREVPAL